MERSARTNWMRIEYRITSQLTNILIVARGAGRLQFGSTWNGSPIQIESHKYKDRVQPIECAQVPNIGLVEGDPGLHCRFQYKNARRVTCPQVRRMRVVTQHNRIGLCDNNPKQGNHHSSQ